MMTVQYKVTNIKTGKSFEQLTKLPNSTAVTLGFFMRSALSKIKKEQEFMKDDNKNVSQFRIDISTTFSLSKGEIK